MMKEQRPASKDLPNTFCEGHYTRYALRVSSPQQAMGFPAGRNYDAEKAQKITDATDSAAVLAIPGSPVIICDHGMQAFEILTDCNEGATIAVEHCDGTRIGYECTAAYHDAVWNDGYTTLADGTSVWKLDGKIVTQVCNDRTGESVTILVWN